MTALSTPTQANDSTVPTVFLTVEQVAERLYVGRSTAYKLITDGEIFHLRFGRLIRVPKHAVDEYITKQSEDQKENQHKKI